MLKIRPARVRNFTKPLRKYAGRALSSMAPVKALPLPDGFDEVDEYVDSLLNFTTTSKLFQTLCGGVHILDFFTQEPGLYSTILPADWQTWLTQCDTMDLLDLLMRHDLNKELPVSRPPKSLLSYIQDVRRHSLGRTYSPKGKQTILPRHVAVGMIPKKVHEVTNFANYIDSLAEDIALQSSEPITHFVDFGSGQNYLGRALASPPYNRHIIAVESKELNIMGAKSMDVTASVAKREVVQRNKKLYRQKMDALIPREEMKEKALRRTAKPQEVLDENQADLRSSRDLATIYTPEEGKGSIQYVEHRVDDGDLSDIVPQIGGVPTAEEEPGKSPRLLAMSIHSCGNLSHHGIRSLLLNPSVHAIAIVGCCYNLLTERLGPPTHKHPSLQRPNLRPLNARVVRASAAEDPHGYPMSQRVGTHKHINGDGVRLNISARMMAVQAPMNWTEKESDAFFTRHYFRALLQKLFLDYGVVSKPAASSTRSDAGSETDAEADINLAAEATDPIIIGSLRKSCYINFKTYVRGALLKLSTNPNISLPLDSTPTPLQASFDKLSQITDDQIQAYADEYAPRKKELSVMWSLMAFSAGVVESLIVTDRWLFLMEHAGEGGEVADAWVEPVFDYGLSPRNLVVVGIKS